MACDVVLPAGLRASLSSIKSCSAMITPPAVRRDRRPGPGTKLMPSVYSLGPRPGCTTPLPTRCSRLPAKALAPRAEMDLRLPAPSHDWAHGPTTANRAALPCCVARLMAKAKPKGRPCARARRRVTTPESAKSSKGRKPPSTARQSSRAAPVASGESSMRPAVNRATTWRSL